MIESPLGFLAAVLLLAGAIPALAARSRSRLFTIVPPVVLTYAVTMALAVAGLWADTPGIETTRGRLLDALLPALVFLMLVPCDLRAVARVGPRLLLAFATASGTIMTGFVVAWLIWRPWLPPDGWQALAGVAGGWIGGTANLVAVVGGLGAPAEAVGLAVITDTVCYSVWVLLLFSAAGSADAFNRWAAGRPAGVMADSAGAGTASANPPDPGPASPLTASVPPSSPALPPSAGRVIGMAATLAAALVVGQAAAAIAGRLPAGGSISVSSWTVLLATVAGAVAAQTPLRRLPAAAPLAAAMLAVVIVAMASRATLAGLRAAPVFVAAGFTVLACHAAGMAVAARLLRLDLASCSVASLANIGGVASAPLMAALHAPALVPAAVLLALLGYLIGVPAGLALAAVLPRLGSGLALPGLLVLMVVAGAAGAAEPERQTAAYWVARCPDAEAELLDAEAVAAANARMVAADPTVRDLAALPERLPRADVAALVAGGSRIPSGPLVRDTGAAVTEADRQPWQAGLALERVPPETAPRFGLAVRRAAIRRLPTPDRILSSPADTDIDRLQETAVFPGTPVAAIHRSADDRWAFVLTPTYAGWIAADAIALGARDEVLSYAAAATRVVTGSRVVTAFTPELPALSQLVLDMGTALPELADWPRRQAVNGQLPWAAHVVQLPCREPDGSLAIRPALVPRSADTHAGPLPATRANVIRQACKFLGDRYGWGHDHDSRDCSGLVCEVYRSLGLVLPRNTADQAVSPALERTPLPATLGRAERLAAVAALAPGDLIYAPRHVMLVLGHDPDTWVIHATLGGGAGPRVNGIVIMPLAEIGGEGNGPIVDAATTLVRVLPAR